MAQKVAFFAPDRRLDAAVNITILEHGQVREAERREESRAPVQQQHIRQEQS